MSRTGIFVAWIAATVVATLLAFAAVSFVVGDLGRGPQVIGTLAVATSTSPSTTPPSTVPGDTTPSPEVTLSSAPSGSIPNGTSSTSVPAGVTPTTTIPSPATTPSSSTTSTTPSGVPSDSVVVATIGGSASISCAGDAVSIGWYTPTPGFSPEVEHGGPNEVELHFESQDWKSKIHADCAGGKVVFEVDERAESG